MGKRHMDGGGNKATPAPPDRNSLEQQALRYLERYASSAARLRQVLRRSLQRAARRGGGEIEGGEAMVDAVIAKLVRVGLLDDARYAEFRAASLARRGGSLYVIRRDLIARGVAKAQIEAALEALKRDSGTESNDEADIEAALALARRRRLGPFRISGARAANRDRDLATLGRAGFGYEVARAVIDREPDTG